MMIKKIFKYLVDIHFNSDTSSKELVFLLNSTLIDGMYGSSVEYNKIMPFHYATKDELSGVKSKLK